MTAKTTIYVETGILEEPWRYSMVRQRSEAKRWSLLVQKCQQYREMGLNYSTRFAHTEMGACLIVEASGAATVKPKRQPKVKPHRDRGRPLNAEQCRKRARKAAAVVNDPTVTARLAPSSDVAR